MAGLFLALVRQGIEQVSSLAGKSGPGVALLYCQRSSEPSWTKQLCLFSLSIDCTAKQLLYTMHFQLKYLTASMLAFAILP